MVSIGIPTRNRAHLLPRTLDSLLRQDHKELEIVISDNASSDDTERICRAYVAQDSRVRYSRNEKNIGLVQNFNRAFGLTRFPYVVLAADDDLYESTFVSSLAARLDAEPGIALVACAVDVIDKDDCFVRSVDQSYLRQPLGNRRRSAQHVLWRGYGNLMSGMYRREDLARTGLFQSVYRDYWDWVDLVLLFDVALSGDIVWIDGVLIHKREGGASGQVVNRSFFATLASFVMAWVAYLKRLARPDLHPGQAVFLAGSILFRIIPALWSGRYFLGYSLLIDIDRTGNLRRRLRRALPGTSMERNTNPPDPGVRKERLDEL